MSNTNINITNETLLIQVLKASNKELIRMYVTGSNKFAAREMKLRGIY